jgi:hypothetical protein
MNEINDLWLGYLEAGDKSSPVVIDPMLDTGNPKTVYMYHLNANKITEYKREIAEPKLRALNDKEVALAQDLQQGYTVARKEFIPRNHRLNLAPAAAGAAVTAAVSDKQASRQRIDIDDSLDDLDMDDDLDMEEDLDTVEDE